SQQQLLKVQQDAMVLRAPADGQVTAVFVRPHEVAMPGLPIATISGAARSPTVVACLDEVQAAKISTGEAARLRTLDGTGQLHHAHVVRVSPAVGQLPPRCWRDPKLPSWGRTADLMLDAPADLLPGQGFSIDFLGRQSEHASDAVAVSELGTSQTEPDPSVTKVVPADRRTGTIAMLVPASLQARTRFEPSGLVWVSALERYVIVSDDTGQADADDHAPWLFTMDTQGHIDEQPLVVDGIDALNDVESIAAAPDGGLYVFSSQSHSRKGKRPRHRQQLVRVGFDGGRPRASAVVVFAELLDDAGAERLRPLGISSTAELEIEGLTTTAAGGLLLGLKAPAASSGNALVWHMADPEAMFASGGLQGAGLTLWAEIPLQVQADGKTSRAGIAELLELADGSLLVAATANTAADPAQQDGALFLVGGREHADVPSRVHTFPGLKPEGLALAADGRNVIVVFDLGTRTPLWMELPWPPA
ncbi:MAG: HlyD family efflux transporter periplasmic adaptor subunit, partial [Deltaproteobacteria bacterium]|nr:HlyD family efflux transporter periplasmic adaptor subunit [Nannocystaceae bacterium]